MVNYIKNFSVIIDSIIQPKNIDHFTVFNQGDLNDIELDITLTHNNASVDLTTNTSVAVFFKRSDNSLNNQDLTNGVTITDMVNGKIKVILNSQTLSIPGLVQAEVHVNYPNNQVLVFRKFSFMVEGSLLNSIPSQNSYQVLTAIQVVSTVSALPPPSANYRFIPYVVQGGAGVADAFYICKKFSNDTYDWVQYA